MNSFTARNVNEQTAAVATPTISHRESKYARSRSTFFGGTFKSENHLPNFEPKEKDSRFNYAKFSYLSSILGKVMKYGYNKNLINTFITENGFKEEVISDEVLQNLKEVLHQCRICMTKLDSSENSKESVYGVMLFVTMNKDMNCHDLFHMLKDIKSRMDILREFQDIEWIKEDECSDTVKVSLGSAPTSQSVGGSRYQCYIERKWELSPDGSIRFLESNTGEEDGLKIDEGCIHAPKYEQFHYFTNLQGGGPYWFMEAHIHIGQYVPEILIPKAIVEIIIKILKVTKGFKLQKLEPYSVLSMLS